MVTVQEAPIVRPPETTGTSANEELPKSSSADSVHTSNGHLEDAENGDQSNQEGVNGMSLILSRLRELEEETGEPERREIARRRKKQLKEIQSYTQDRSKLAEDKLNFLHARILAQFKEQSRVEAELIPLRRKCEQAVKSKDEAQSETKQKAAMIEKLQELCRKLQAQNKEMKEEDILKRKQLINSFQNTLDDIKSRVDYTEAKREESLQEKKAHLDIQAVLEQHYSAKVKELEIRLELAEARQRQAEVTAAEHQHQAKIEAANFQEASRLLSEMGYKYKEFETSMKDNTEAFRKMASESAQQVKVNTKLETLLAAKNAEVQRLKQDITVANAKIIQMANDYESLKSQLEAASGAEMDRLRTQKDALQKLARSLQQEIKALKSVRAPDADATQGISGVQGPDEAPGRA